LAIVRLTTSSNLVAPVRGSTDCLRAADDWRPAFGRKRQASDNSAPARTPPECHIDATIRLLDPSVDPSKIPTKRRVIPRIKLFLQGELGPTILGILREADAPIATADVVAARHSAWRLWACHSPHH